MGAAIRDIEQDRATATLYGLALGDALGMPSQTLTREEIRQHYGTIAGFVAPFAGHPVSGGLGAAQVTDDTEQTILLARRLIDCPGAFDAKGWAEDLLAWEAGVQARGLLDLLGPSSKAALEDAGSGLADIVRTRVILTAIDNWKQAIEARKLAVQEGIFTGVSGGSTVAVAMQVAEKAPATAVTQGTWGNVRQP